MVTRRGPFAAIDVGSNTVKLTIAERDAEGRFRSRVDTAVTTRLGEGFAGRRLQEEPMRRTVDQLAEFAAICRRAGVVRLAAVGTSALRDACNADEFVERAAETGVRVRVINGAEEARLSFLSVRRDPSWRAADQLLVLDIGGGSTEIITGAGEEMLRRVSLSLGAVRVTESYLKSDPPTVEELEQAAASVRRALEDGSLPNLAGAVVGVGGTCTTMAAVHLAQSRFDWGRIHGAVLDVWDVERQVDYYAGRTVEERKKIVGLPPSRADIILGGALILREALYLLEKERLTISARGLRWGLIYDMFG